MLAVIRFNIEPRNPSPCPQALSTPQESLSWLSGFGVKSTSTPEDFHLQIIALYLLLLLLLQTLPLRLKKKTPVSFPLPGWCPQGERHMSHVVWGRNAGRHRDEC
jgi:hypothetical protein